MTAGIPPISFGRPGCRINGKLAGDLPGELRPRLRDRSLPHRTRNQTGRGAGGATIVLEADGLNAYGTIAWSVIVKGPAEVVDSAQDVQEAADAGRYLRTATPAGVPPTAAVLGRRRSCRARSAFRIVARSTSSWRREPATAGM